MKSRRMLLLFKASCLILAITVGLAWLWAWNSTRYLRPSADDYCIGIRGDLGILGGFLNDWQTFSGFATPSFVTNALLGVPLSNLPLSVALAIPFLGAALAVAAAGLLLIGPPSFGFASSRAWTRVLIGSFMGMVLWWSYLWSGYSSSGLSAPSKVALGLTHWQNLNTGYVIPIALVVLLGTWLVKSDFTAWYWTCTLAALLGVVAGFAGPATALATLVCVPIFMVALWALDRRDWLSKALMVWIVCLVCLVVSLNAPGTRNRAEVARSGVDTSISSIPGWFIAVVPDGVIAWFNSFWEWRSLLILGVGVAVTYALRAVWGSQIRINTGMAWLGVTVFALCLSTATIVTDRLAYGAYWHQSNVTVLVFLSLLLLGVTVGGWLPAPGSRVAMVALPFVLVALALSCLASVVDMTVSISNRYAAWEVGPAPIAGVIEDREVEWIGNCWDQLQVIRQG